ncbi:unnamed protein product [Prunus armeniaca]
MGCSSSIHQLSQTRRLSGLPFYSQSFSRFPQGAYDVVPSSFQPESFSRSCHLSHCISLSVRYVFTWDDFVTISKPVKISGATRKRSKSAIALSLESHSEFLPFEIEDHSQRKIQTLMAVSFIAEHRTRAVGDVIKSLGEEHSPVPRQEGSVKGLDNEVLEVTLCALAIVLAREEYSVVGLETSVAYGVHMNGYVEKDGKKFLWIAKRSQQKPTYIIYIQGCLII